LFRECKKKYLLERGKWEMGSTKRERGRGGCEIKKFDYVYIG